MLCTTEQDKLLNIQKKDNSLPKKILMLTKRPITTSQLIASTQPSLQKSLQSFNVKLIHNKLNRAKSFLRRYNNSYIRLLFKECRY
jgi:site-specific recombinase